jgi:phage baseplate assembly protein W
MSDEFVGKGFSSPMRIDHTGSVTFVSGPENIENAIATIVSTAPGERPFRPLFGCQIWELIFDPINESTLQMMSMFVSEALEMWEPRITVTSVEAEPGDEDGEVLLDIAYTIISTNDERNLVFPFYIIPAEEE